MKASLAMSAIVPLALIFGPLGGCALFSGNTADCPAAQHQLQMARTAASLAQIALASAQALGSPPGIALAQTALNTINTDIAAIQNLVTQTCTPTPTVTAIAGRHTITLAEAHRLASSDKKLAQSVADRVR